MERVALTGPQRAELLRVLAAHSPPIERVDAYGSRANGSARNGSDIDLVLAGPIDQRMLGRIHSAIDDSYLSIFADLAAYDLLTEGLFRDQVLATAVTLFGLTELMAARVRSEDAA